MCRMVVATLLLIGLAGSAWAGGDEAVAAYQLGDYTTAKREWLALARQGNAEAQTSLGGMHENGLGVPRDYAAAAKWYIKASEQLFAPALAKLGHMYGDGLGVPRDDVEAYKWFTLAFELGNREGLVGRDWITAKMTPAQISEAQKRALAWAAKHPRK